MNRRVLVTGASGFVGMPAIAEIVRQGVEVHALSTRPAPPGDAPAGVHWHRVDLANERAAAELISELAPEQLLHMAWYVEHGRFWNAAANVQWVQRSLSLLQAFAEAGGRRAVMLGTCAEYDWRACDGPLREDGSPIAPSTLYGVAKDALRRVSGAYAAEMGFELAWGRLFFLYGPREDPGRLVAAVIRSLLAGQEVRTSSGLQRRDFMHVADVGAALAALLDSDVVGAVNIATGEDVAVGAVIDLIAAQVGRPELILRGGLPDRPDEPPLLVADVSRLHREVGYAAARALADGIADAVEWWRAEQPRERPDGSR